MTYDETKIHLLKDDAFTDELDSEAHLNRNHDSSRKNRSSFTILTCIALIISLGLNGFFVWNYHSTKAQRHLCVSEYTGIGLSIKNTYWQQTDFTNENRTISDQAWESIDTSPNTIALDHTYAEKHGLSKSIPFPWDESKGLYLIRAFHHIHCLKNMRRAYLDALESHPGQHQLIPQEHIMHCLDILRQDIKCRPDDTPMPSIQQRHKWGDGQVRQCKDWDALVKWTQHPSRHACFKMLSDYRRVPNSLEEFAFCLEDSPYTEIMEEYFREHGHRDPYQLDEVQDGVGAEDAY